jgi:hypothetical protein
MKNQYFGDINDYRKYGLLRGLSNNGKISTLVCWMLTENDSRPDGKFISYIGNKEKFSKYDPELFNILSDCLKSENRGVGLCRDNNIIPNANYYESIIPDNKDQRNNYFENIYPIATKHDLIFLDPDNGLEINSKRKGNKDSSKYLYYDEVYKLYKQGSSLLIYQHFIRERKIKFIQRISDDLMASTRCSIVFPIITPKVVFFLLPIIGTEEYFYQRLLAVVQDWGGEIRVLI